jgi:hypothetical protein
MLRIRWHLRDQESIALSALERRGIERIAKQSVTVFRIPTRYLPINLSASIIGAFDTFTMPRNGVSRSRTT